MQKSEDVLLVANLKFVKRSRLTVNAIFYKLRIVFPNADILCIIESSGGGEKERETEKATSKFQDSLRNLLPQSKALSRSNFPSQHQVTFAVLSTKCCQYLCNPLSVCFTSCIVYPTWNGLHA